MARVAINGLGRIGRAVLKIVIDTPELELVAVNDLVPPDNLVYLLKHDSVYGRYENDVHVKDKQLVIEDRQVKWFSESDPSDLPWKKLDIDLVFECTGVFTRKQDMEKHLKAGASKVLLSAPAKGEGVTTVVYGVNEDDADHDSLVSCASCTTNCIAPVVEVVGRRIGVLKAVMTTVHAYTASQSIVDAPAKKMRRGRAGAINLVPTTTGAAKATTLTLPQYVGKFDGIAIRGPVPVASIADITFLTERETTVQEVNDIFESESETGRYDGILGTSDEELVSSDMIKDPHASMVDVTMTQVVDGNLVKVLSWYDNEWGYASQMVREAVRLVRQTAEVV
jgi:glyceraldehyde 3-phosphate dehydrogenase